MSITAGLSSDPEKLFKKSFPQRNDSGELDVFEAARYFSGANEVSGANFTQKIMRDQDRQAWIRGGRISLDIPMMSRSSIPAQTHHVMEKPMKEKKYKQPNSPGGRLASFLNSLFSQTSNSKKKKSKSSTQSIKDEDESPGGGRRKRRSSISHFRSGNSSTTAYSKSIYSSSTNSGFRTPPPYANTPTKNYYKDFRSYSDHKPVLVTTLPKINNGHIVKSAALQNEVCDSKKGTDNAWLDEKFKFSTTIGFSEKYQTFGNGFLDKAGRSWTDQNPSEEREFRKFSEMDDGADSDSSSDLFELQNYDLGCCYSSGLPVYETTHMDSIKRGVPIASGAI